MKESTALFFPLLSGHETNGFFHPLTRGLKSWVHFTLGVCKSKPTGNLTQERAEGTQELEDQVKLRNTDFGYDMAVTLLNS